MGRNVVVNYYLAISHGYGKSPFSIVKSRFSGPKVLSRSSDAVEMDLHGRIGTWKWHPNPEINTSFRVKLVMDFPVDGPFFQFQTKPYMGVPKMDGL